MMLTFAQSMTALGGFGFRLGRREQNPQTPQLDLETKRR